MDQHTNLIVSAYDSGYGLICPECNARHGHAPSRVGQSRWLSVEICASCEEKLVAKQKAKAAKRSTGRVWPQHRDSLTTSP
jgi:hypothetical protein